MKSATATGTAIPFTLTVGTNNQITSALFTYDASGNELTDATSTYAWNAESEMKSGGGVTYVYDGRGNRVEKSGSKFYWYGPNGEVLDETDTTGSTANSTFSEYIYFDGTRVARRDYQNNQYYYLQDPVNSSRAIAEVLAGTRTATLCYDADFYPYGGEIVFTNTCAQNYKFQGKERDTETGNDYFGARFYSSTYGRFLSPDWSSVPVAVPYANLANPQTLNMYALVSDNPESFADLDGHCGEANGAIQNVPCPPAQTQTTPTPNSQNSYVTVDKNAGTATLTVTDSKTVVGKDANGNPISTTTTVTNTITVSTTGNNQVLGGTTNTTTTVSSLAPGAQTSSTTGTGTQPLNALQAVQAVGGRNVQTFESQVAPTFMQNLWGHKIGVGGSILGGSIAVGCVLAEPCGAGVTIFGIGVAVGSGIYDSGTHP